MSEKSETHLKMVVLRHGKYERGSGDHRKWLLSHEGSRQCQERRGKLGNPEFDLAFCSLLPRTRQTAQIVAGLEEDPRIIPIPELFYTEDNADGKAMAAMFAKLRHASLSQYYEEPNSDVLRNMAAAAWITIGESVQSHNPSATSVLVVSHGILLNAIGNLVFPECEEILSRVLRECEGFVLYIKDDRVVNLEFIED